jgi:hypothetical protein
MPGQVVLDPFAGRGTSVYSAAINGRIGIGIEINPVGWAYAQTKLSPASRMLVEARIKEIGRIARRYRSAALSLPVFFHRCYRLPVRSFLLAARANLDWRHSVVDRTLMSILLVHLHGKTGNALSNQLRQAKAMSPRYAVQWWSARGLKAPEVDPVEYLLNRVAWRYAKGVPTITPGSRAYLADSIRALPRLRTTLPGKASLLFTSPPYYGITDYHYDQWLRLWLLGAPPYARRTGLPNRGRFESVSGYGQLLTDVFNRAASVLHPEGTIYVRTGRDTVTVNATRSVLRQVFPGHRVIRKLRRFDRPTQTMLFKKREKRQRKKAGAEVDFILVKRS